MEQPKKSTYGSVQVFGKKKTYFEVNVETQEPINQTNLEFPSDKIMIIACYSAPFPRINQKSRERRKDRWQYSPPVDCT
jgi:hypothetical protein